MSDEPELVESKLVPVRIVETRGKATLVQWDDGRLHRAYVPTDALDGQACPDTVLQDAPAYGVPWELLLDLSAITPEAVANALRKKGIWTTKDVHTQSRALLTLGSGFIGRPVFHVADSIDRK